MFAFFLLAILSLANCDQPQISVTGKASTLVNPTHVTVSFSVNTLDQQASKALSDNNQKLNSIVLALKAINITEDELGTSSFSIQAQYENIYVTDHYENKFKGYQASQTLIVNTKKFSLAGKMIDEAISSNDATTVNSVNFYVSDDIKQQIKNELIEKAVLDAKYRANLALGALDCKTDLINTLNLNDFNDGGFDQFKTLMRDVATGETNLFSGASEISLSISATFTIKKK